MPTERFESTNEKTPFDNGTAIQRPKKNEEIVTHQITADYIIENSKKNHTRLMAIREEISKMTAEETKRRKAEIFDKFVFLFDTVMSDNRINWNIETVTGVYVRMMKLKRDLKIEIKEEDYETTQTLRQMIQSHSA